jgi:hypothetical protein
MEAFPIRNVLGYGELFWSLRQWLTKRRSLDWQQVLGTVEGYELLTPSRNGWFVVFYSYELEGKQFSGEWRTWLLFSFSSMESKTGKVIARLPVGSKIELRVDPDDPTQSTACL